MTVPSKYRFAIGLSVALAACAVVEPLLPILVLGCAVYALIGSKESIQAISLAGLAKILNPALFPMGGFLALAGWAVILAAFARTVTDALVLGRLRFPKIWIALCFFVGVGLVLSVYSLYPSISALKILSFFFVSSACLLAFSNAKDWPWEAWFVGTWIAVIFLSLPTLVVRSIGYERDNLGFQGILNHPQMLSIFCAPILAWCLGQIVQKRRVALLPMSLGVMVIAYIILSRGRVGFAAVGLAGLWLFLVAIVRRAEWRRAIKRFFLRPAVVLSGIVFLIALIPIRDKLIDFEREFVRKGVVGVSLTQAFHDSRGFVIDESMENFKDRPFHGIGFGVSRSKYFPFIPEREPITGLPIGAPIEKPNMVVALLEEMGVVGSIAIVPFLLMLLRGLTFRQKSLALSAVGLVCLFANVGETVFFSVGGFGQLMWVLVAWSYSCRRFPDEVLVSNADLHRGSPA